MSEPTQGQKDAARDFFERHYGEIEIPVIARLLASREEALHKRIAELEASIAKLKAGRRDALVAAVMEGFGTSSDGHKRSVAESIADEIIKGKIIKGKRYDR